MIVMPLFHVAGTNVSFSGLAQGGRLVLVKDFTAPDAVRMMREENVAHAFLAPAMIQMMLLQPGANGGAYPALKSIAYGASPIAEDVRSEEHTSELQSIISNSYAVCSLKKETKEVPVK